MKTFVLVLLVLSLTEIAPAALAAHHLRGVQLIGVVLCGAGWWPANALITRAAGN